MTLSPSQLISSLEAEIAALTTSPPPTPIPTLLTTIHATLSTLTLQITTLSQAILAPSAPRPPESPPRTLIVPGPSSTNPAFIIDSHANTWTIQPSPRAAIPTLCLNGHPDPFTSPTTSAYYINATIFFQRITGQWYQWSTNYWLPATDPTTPSSPDWGPPALRSTEVFLPDLFPRPDLPINFDLLNSLFTDPSPTASTFLPSPIPLTTRPRGINRPPIYQRSDNTFLIPLSGYSTPITLQFPGLRPTFLRLWSALSPQEGASSSNQPIRTATGTDTIAVPLTRDSIFIIELSLG